MTLVFDSAVPFYRYRAGYPEELFDLVIDRVGLTDRDRVLDIGCGPGPASIPLARRVGEVIAIDPVAGMLDAGRAAAELAGVGNIVWRQGDSAGLAGLDVAGARLAVFAASFHWTDRPAVLLSLDRLLETDGVVVVIHDDLGDEEQPDWVGVIAEIRARYLGPERRTAVGGYSPDSRTHRGVLGGSPFSDVTTVAVAWQRTLTVEALVGLQFSYSFCTPAMFGDRAGAFAADVRAAVLDLHPSGTLTEPLRVDVLIARRAR